MAFPSSANQAFSAAQFVRQFAECRSLARDEPVFISSYGRTTHALVAIAQFEALTQGDPSDADPSDADKGMAADLVREWGMRTGQAILVCDAHTKVQSISWAGCDLMGMKERDAVGAMLEDVLPSSPPPYPPGDKIFAADSFAKGSAPYCQGHSGLIITLAQRCLRLREDVSAEIPSPFAANAWLKVACYLWRDHVVIVFKDITAEVRLERLADREGALAQALALHHDMGFVQLSLRGQVEQAGAGLAALTGLPQARLIGAHFIDMVDIHSRAAFRAAMESVLSGKAVQRLKLRLISNCTKDSTKGIALSLVQLRGAYGVEGLIMVLKQEGVIEESADRQPL